MNFKTPLIVLGAAISASAFAETLTYDGSAKGSFYDGAYWGDTVPSETSDIVFDDKAKTTAYAQFPQKLPTSSLTTRQKQPLMSLTQKMA